MTEAREMAKDAIREVITFLESLLEDDVTVTGDASIQREAELREKDDSENRWVEYQRTGRERVTLSLDVWVKRAVTVSREVQA